MSTAPLLQPFGRPAWTPEPARVRSGALMLAVHALMAVALWNGARTSPSPHPPEPLEVRLIAPQPQTDRPKATATAVPTMPLRDLAVEVPVPEIAVAPAPSVEVAATPPVAVLAPSSSTSPLSTAPAATVPPKVVPASALRYRVEPAVEVPRLSRRAGESGRVGLRVLFDTQGSPREIQLSRSSGFARLDAQALEAMQRARIQPIVEDGRPIEVIAQAWLEYELD